MSRLSPRSGQKGTGNQSDKNADVQGKGQCTQIRGEVPQCEIIQGRLPGKLLAAFLPRLLRRMDLPEQQEQPAPWLAFICDSACGAWALRSLVACAKRRSAGMAAK